jgi:hypothetical protein
MCEYSQIMHKEATSDTTATSDQMRAIDIAPMQHLTDILLSASTPGSDITI